MADRLIPLRYYIPTQETHQIARQWRAYQTRLRGELLSLEEEKRRLVQSMRRPPVHSYLATLPTDVRKNVLAAITVETIDAQLQSLRAEEAHISRLISERRENLAQRADLHAEGFSPTDTPEQQQYFASILHELSLLTPTRRQ